MIALGALPEASDRVGRDDVGLDMAVSGLFGLGAREAAVRHETRVKLGETGGVAAILPAATDAPALVRRIHGADPDFKTREGEPAYFVHRRAGYRDIYGFYGLAKGTPVTFRATGRVELWDPWTGSAKPLPVLAQDASVTRLRLPLEATEIQLVVFSPGRAEVEKPAPAKPPRAYEIRSPWTATLKPTLDNRWGDFRWPPTPAAIGAEARKFRYAFAAPGAASPPAADDRFAGWRDQTSSFGPVFLRLGPFLADEADAMMEAGLAAAVELDPARPVRYRSGERRWEPYDLSWRWGVEDDPGHQGYHGLKESVSDDFIRLGKPKPEWTKIAREAEPGGPRHYLWTTAVAPRAMKAVILAGGMMPAAVWIGGRRVADIGAAVELGAGPNPVLLRYDAPGSGWFLLAEPGFAAPQRVPGDLAMSWHGATGILPFDVRPDDPNPAGWYRFTAAAGLKALTLTAIGDVEAWADGRRLEAGAATPAADGARRTRFVLNPPASGEAAVVLRVRHERGRYGGAALPEPISFECGEGALGLGDWAAREGLASYSGGMLYRTSFTWPADEEAGAAIIDLGDVASSAELF